MFVLYTNDIDEEIEKKRAEKRGEKEDEQGGVYAYADDASTTIDCNTIIGLTKEVNQTVKDLVSYYASLSLVPNMQKTHIQLFNRNTQIQVEIEGTPTPVSGQSISSRYNNTTESSTPSLSPQMQVKGNAITAANAVCQTLPHVKPTTDTI